MEQTLGKRIQLCRKSLGLTQEQLAEKLGITAQAVSKWENDQSCPDITMLPKLAEIFGTTTDALLGRQTEPVHEATLVEVESEDPDSQEQKKKQNHWEFRYESCRRVGIFFALGVLLTGTLTLLSKIYSWDVSFWDILWPTALFTFGIYGLFPKFSFFRIGSALFGVYFLLENLNVLNLDMGELAFPIIVIILGLSLLVDALRKPRKPGFKLVHRNGNEVSDNLPINNFELTENHFDIEVAWSEANYPIALPQLDGGDISCNFGDITVDLSVCERVSPSCHIDVECNFGEVTLLVPGRFCVQPQQNTTFAAVQIVGHADPNPEGVIRVDAEANFGQITIKYI